MTTEFDFMDTETKFALQLYPDTILRIDRVSHSIARVYFTDAENNQKNIPHGFEIFVLKFNGDRVLGDYVNQQYCLCFTEDYSLTHLDMRVLTLRNQRKWSVDDYWTSPSKKGK
jgi:hypothetical protein